MSLSRRDALRRLALGSGGSAALAVRGLEARAAGRRVGGQTADVARVTPRSAAIRLNSNENPLGPSAAALRAIERAFTSAGRYPMNARPATDDLRALIARKHGVRPEEIALGAGSGEILDSAVRAFTSGARGLVAGLPTFEAPARVARAIQSPVVEVPLDERGRLDLAGMVRASPGAGLVFICNPNNPTGTIQSATAIAHAVQGILGASPETIVLVDEAYHDYVGDPSYATALPLVRRHRQLIVSRTLSKAHGMAGLRVGYAVAARQTIERLEGWNMPFNVSTLTVAAAAASLADEPQIARERQRNAEALQETVRFFQAAGMTATDSQANFVWVNLGRPAQAFREACEQRGILVGRSFPPLDQTHCRISIGTMEEMQRAFRVFRTVLALPPATVAGGRAIAS
ncbi:MAG TPA: aminotransferase class I/II-fold pyridoxal phosphate-dependent enzyme [Vicinamibacterales bacterium]|nr:aminotransferase class I/II-fold pyridoxal phosphate-dependent enzyme [Vicinamibacterales bacterium]